MIPLRDTIPSRFFPVVTVTIIAVNTLVFLYEVSLGRGLNTFIDQHALVPATMVSIFQDQGFKVGAVVPIFSSMFLHGGWIHLIGNMLYLWIFGDNVEDRMGRGRFLLFYLLCGTGAAALHVYMSPSSNTPTIGASGAIAGVLGAYFLLFPRARVLTLLPIFFLIQFIEVPAFLFLAFWFLMQFFSGALSIGVEASGGGVAWWAHVGGFATGMALVFPFRKYR
jgi:membrane associated rhomboid family serine protease